MQNVVLGLQGGRADGTESTFDSQPMQVGTHLRWAFAPELGFPQNGFRLCRRVTQPNARQNSTPCSIAGHRPG